MKAMLAVCLMLFAAGIAPGQAVEMPASDMPANDIPGVIITPVWSATTTASGQPIEVPARPEVVVSRYQIPPGITLPLHQHPYPRYAYVLSGTLEVAVSGGKTFRYRAGDFIIEVVNQWHAGKNAGDTPVQLLVIDQVVPGHSNTISANHN